MGIFSRTKKSKATAAAATTADPAKPPPAPYRHIPKHAAMDAMTGSPTAFRIDDAAKVVEANKHRSAIMTRSASDFSFDTKFSEHRPNGLPRTSSSMSVSGASFLSLPAVPAIPEKHLRAGSSQGSFHAPPSVGMRYSHHHHSHGGAATFTIGRSPLATPLETTDNSPVESSQSSIASSPSSRTSATSLHSAVSEQQQQPTSAGSGRGSTLSIGHGTPEVVDLQRISFSDQQCFKEMHSGRRASSSPRESPILGKAPLVVTTTPTSVSTIRPSLSPLPVIDVSAAEPAGDVLTRAEISQYHRAMTAMAI